MKTLKPIIRVRINHKMKLKLLEIKNNTGQSVNSIICIAIKKELVRRKGKYNTIPF
jgi:hypothetical protein